VTEVSIVTTWVDVRRTAAVAIVAHAAIHLLGVMTAWRLSPFRDPPYGTVVLGGTLDAGEAGQLVMGAAWLVAAVALVGAAVAIWRGGSHVLSVVAAAFAISLAVSLAGLPSARFGVVIDITVLGLIAAVRLEPPVERLVHRVVAPRRPHLGGRN
jgi:hypothetical protein